MIVDGGRSPKKQNIFKCYIKNSTHSATDMFGDLYLETIHLFLHILSAMSLI